MMEAYMYINTSHSNPFLGSTSTC